MRDDEDRLVERRLVTPPAERPGIVLPGPLAAAEHPPAHHDGALRAHVLLEDLVVRVDVAALHPVELLERLQPNDPLVQQLSAPAQRLLERRVRSRDVAVERDRDLGNDLAHLRRLRRGSSAGCCLLCRPEEQPAERRGERREQRADDEGEVVAAGQGAELAVPGDPQRVRP